MIRFFILFIGIIVGALIMFGVLSLINAYREYDKISKHLHEINQDDIQERKETDE